MTTHFRAAVLGHPVAHSLSPTLHNAAYQALGLDGWDYVAIDTTVEQLAERLALLGPGAGCQGNPDEPRSAESVQWFGYSLTMPLKHEIMRLAQGRGDVRVSDVARATGVANTVYRQTDPMGIFTLSVDNTDVTGIVTAIREVIRHGPISSAAILGSGATAASAVAALHQLGCTAVTIYSRDKQGLDALQNLAELYGIDITYKPLTAVGRHLAEADVVVSTLPAHAADPIADGLSEAGGALLDVVYDPLPSDLLARWSALGGATISGERMLLHQAAEQVELFTTRQAPVAAMEAALARELDQRLGLSEDV